MQRPTLRFIAAVAAPYGVYLLHACLFGAWIVDDAGISFAYARNLAAGHGLVAQPGVPPVEGYSNVLWVGLMALFFPPRLFDPVVTPKLVSAALVAVTFVLLHRALVRLDPAGAAVSFFSLSLLALSTPFVLWTVSGLENPLYVCLICLLFGLVVRERTEGPAPRLSWAAGLAAAGIALTRPDGILFAPLYPLLTGPSRGRIARFSALFLLVFGGFLAFRLAYFGDLYPNTYHAKGGPSGSPLVAALALGAIVLAVRRLRWGPGVALVFAAWAAAAFLLLPKDWMGEYRFATPLFPFLYAAAGLLGAALGRALIPRSGLRRVAAWAASALVLGLAVLLFLPRSRTYAAAPALPFVEVEQKIGQRFNRYADALGVREGSLLVPDVGGALWSSRLRVYDLGGLTDRTIARTLHRQPEAFREYVFAETRPTFILVHGPWALVAALNRDPRFRRDYLPLFVEGDPRGEITVGPGRQSGIFVRKEAAAGKEEAVRAIRAELSAEASGGKG